MGYLARLGHALWPQPVESQERALVRLIDLLLLSYICLQYCVNYLDRVNFYNAYVSGMAVDLNMQGRDYNKVIAVFTVGFAISNIPQNLLLLVVPPRWLFPINGVIWGILTALTACATKVSHLYVLKFFQGVAESSTFVGAHYILGSWYLPSEIGRRAALFSISGQAATLFSGPLMSRMYYDLGGKGGVKGWQYMFIICGVITIPVAAYGIFVFPDTPSTTTSRFLTPSQKALAISRLQRAGGGSETLEQGRRKRLDWTLVKRVLGRWHVWCLGVVWIAGGALESYSAWGIQALWMRAQRVPSPTTGLPVARFTVKQLNYHPMGIAGVAIVALAVTAVATDHRPSKRYVVNLVIALCAIVYGVIPLVGSKSRAAGQAGREGGVGLAGWYFAFYLSGISYAGQASNFSWANEIAKGDDQERGVLLAAMNVIAYAFNAWFQPVFWPVSSAPHFTSGFALIVAFAPILAVSTGVTRWLQVRDQRRAIALSLEGEEEGEGQPPSPGLSEEEGKGGRKEAVGGEKGGEEEVEMAKLDFEGDARSSGAVVLRRLSEGEGLKRAVGPVSAGGKEEEGV